MSIFSFIVGAVYFVEITYFIYIAIKVDKPACHLLIFYLGLYVIALSLLIVIQIFLIPIAIVDIVMIALIVYGFVLQLKLKKKH